MMILDGIVYLFTKVFYMTIAATLIYGLLLLFLALLGKRLRKNTRYYLHSIVLIAAFLPITLPIGEKVQGIERIQSYFEMDLGSFETRSVDDAVASDEESNSTTQLANMATQQTNHVSQDLVKTTNVNEKLKLIDLIAILWSVGVVILVCYRIGVRITYIRKLAKGRAMPNGNNEEWYQELNVLLFQESAKLSFRKIPRIQMNQLVTGPMIFGLFCPTIYLPVEKTDVTELQLILRHELVHYKRKDLWYKEGFALMSIVHWFNPILRKLVHKINIACELSCDERVILGMDKVEKKSYSKAILMAIYREKHREPVMVAGMNEEGSVTQMRIKEIMAEKKVSLNKVFGLCVVCLIGGFLGCSVLTAGMINAQNRKTTNKNIGVGSEASEEALSEDNGGNEQFVVEEENGAIGSSSSFAWTTAKEDFGDNSNIKLDIAKYLNSPASYPTDTLDQVLYDYVAKTLDIGAAETIKSFLSQEGLDKIVKNYMEQTQDYGVVYLFESELSDETFQYGDELAKLSNNTTYASNGYADTYKRECNVNSDLVGDITVSGEGLTGTQVVYSGYNTKNHLMKVDYSLTVTTGTVSVIYIDANNIEHTVVQEASKGSVDINTLNGTVGFKIVGNNASFHLNLILN
ncbi:M56 family metallopeptidase [Anaerosporobacter faecicola]|uniref:M56 family metallopeptidase n=1 Tax=Anaerosporobacter faecicola TaxID=2718714 RepID=UPI001438802D|nr:M56 family metallopeptidase [Anaerosporobacter faecicola]